MRRRGGVDEEASTRRRRLGGVGEGKEASAEARRGGVGEEVTQQSTWGRTFYSPH